MMIWRWQCLSPTSTTASRLSTSLFCFSGRQFQMLVFPVCLLVAVRQTLPSTRFWANRIHSSKQSIRGRRTGCLYCFAGRRYFYSLARKRRHRLVTEPGRVTRGRFACRPYTVALMTCTTNTPSSKNHTPFSTLNMSFHTSIVLSFFFTQIYTTT